MVIDASQQPFASSRIIRFAQGSMMKNTLWFCAAFICWCQIKAQEASKIVYDDSVGYLRYVADVEGNYLPDFSYAGYGYGEVPLPEVPVVKSIDPIEGDNTAHIQGAIDEIGSMVPDSNGIRGALLLNAGIYRVAGSLILSHSGLVLRGVGQEDDSTHNSIIVGTGNTPELRDVIKIGGASGYSWTKRITGSTSSVTNDFVPAGSRTLHVENPNLFQVGDNVIVYHPSTDGWLASIDYGSTDSDDPWKVGDLDLYFNRSIIAIHQEEGKIELDVPIYDHLDLSLSETEIYRPDRQAIKNNIGIENIRVVIETAGELDEEHAKNAVRFLGAEDCWAKEVTALHFVYAGFDTRVANRVSVINCTAIEPHSMITGARRYNFAVGSYSNNILFEGCHATKGRHSFVSNGTSSVSGIVFYNSTSDHDFAASEGHRRWSQGLLFDNLTFTNSETRNLIGLYNRGDFGTGHGWASVHSVAWSVRVPGNRGILIQKPPHRQNYAIACRGLFSNPPPFRNHLDGYVELSYRTPVISSLYEKQFEYRVSGKKTLDAAAKLNAVVMDGTVSLSWLDISAEEEGYVVEYALGQDSFKELASLAENTVNYHWRLPGTISEQINFRVYARAEKGVSPYSNPVTIDISTDVKVVESSNIQIYPNPARNAIWFDNDTNAHIQIRCFTADGRLMGHFRAIRSIDISTWPPGIYHLEFGNGLVNRYARVVKI